MEIIDLHTHIYPEKIAQKATESIGAFYDSRMETLAGTAEQLLADGLGAGIGRFVVHSVATTAHQVHSINSFLKREIDAHPEFIGFITLHPELSEAEMRAEVEWGLENGFHGIKLHPDFQQFYVDSEEAERIYRVCEGKMPILLHIGDDRYDYSSPRRLAKMAGKYPNVTFIAAHFGAYRRWDEADVYQGLSNVYFDTSSSLPFIKTERAKQIIDTYGADKFFFGTDFPMWRAGEELERFYRIPLTDEERKLILSENAKRVLNLN